MKPDFAVIGAQKGGSTALAHFLRSHPDVYVPDQETRYFRDPWFHIQDPAALDFPAVAIGVRRCGLKCPDLLGLAYAPRRLHDVLGEIDLVATLREPVERAVSAYFWHMQWGLLPLQPAESGLRDILEGRADPAFPRSADILEFGRYGAHLTRYRRTFAPTRILVLLAQDLRADPARAQRQLAEFLGIDPDAPMAVARHRRSNEGVYAMSRLRFLQRRQRYLLREYPGFSGRFIDPPTRPLPRVLDKSIAAVDRLVLARVVDNAPPTLSARLQHDLAEYYADDVRLLSQLLQRDLTEWTRRYA